jgi:hypothetical protein
MEAREKEMMKRIALFATLMTLLACGGSGITLPNIYAGTWSGTYSVVQSTQVGTVNISIGNDGSVSGTGVNTTLGKNFTVNGTIDNAGDISGTLGGGLSGTLSGKLGFAVNGHLTGSINQTISGGGTFASNYDLTKQ